MSDNAPGPLAEPRFRAYVGRIVHRGLRETGTLAHLLHRITGVLLVAYLCLHLGAMSLARFQGQTFEDLMSVFRQPAFLIADWVVLVGVLLHGLNGLRIVLFDLGLGLRHQAALFWGFMSLGGGLAFVALLLLFPQLTGGL